MSNYKKAISLSPLMLISVLLCVGIVFTVTTAFKNNNAVNIDGVNDKDSTKNYADSIKNAAQLEQESKQAFLKAYTVFMNPRCMNCHPKGNQPLQGDDSHPHAQNVWRGTTGKGLYAMKCKNCHQDKNLDAPYSPPGNPHWSMPPASKPMVFEGKSPRQLAIGFKNNQFTGFKTLNDMIKHVDEESLVISSFNPPAGFTKIKMSHEEFVATVKEWIAKGAAVPD